MEETMHQSFKKRNELITNRRQNDVKDEAEEVSGKANTGTLKNCEILYTNNLLQSKFTGTLITKFLPYY